MGNEQYLPEDYEHDITGRISDFYGIHIDAMTKENLRSKSHIAWELSRRDLLIEQLQAALKRIVEAQRLRIDARDRLAIESSKENKIALAEKTVEEYESIKAAAPLIEKVKS